jgi:hypothetical protein
MSSGENVGWLSKQLFGEQLEGSTTLPNPCLGFGWGVGIGEGVPLNNFNGPSAWLALRSIRLRARLVLVSHPQIVLLLIVRYLKSRLLKVACLSFEPSSNKPGSTSMSSSNKFGRTNALDKMGLLLESSLSKWGVPPTSFSNELGVPSTSSCVVVPASPQY